MQHGSNAEKVVPYSCVTYAVTSASPFDAGSAQVANVFQAGLCPLAFEPDTGRPAADLVDASLGCMLHWWCLHVWYSWFAADGVVFVMCIIWGLVQQLSDTHISTSCLERQLTQTQAYVPWAALISEGF